MPRRPRRRRRRPDRSSPLPSDVPGLIDYANDHFDRAQAALRAGDFATYGDEIARVQAALDRLDALAPGSRAGARSLARRIADPAP